MEVEVERWRGRGEIKASFQVAWQKERGYGTASRYCNTTLYLGTLRGPCKGTLRLPKRDGHIHPSAPGDDEKVPT